MEFINANMGTFIFLLWAGTILFACIVSLLWDYVSFRKLPQRDGIVIHDQETDIGTKSTPVNNKLTNVRFSKKPGS